MQILLAILGIAVGVGFWLWRARLAAKATIETADDIRAAVRRFGFNRKAKGNPLDGIEDPRLAAAGILVAVANMDGPPGRDEIAAIAEECRRTFGTGAEEAEQITAYGRWLVQQSANMDEAIRRLARNLVGKLTAEEKGELLAMAERIAGLARGSLSDSQRYTLESLGRQLG